MCNCSSSSTAFAACSGAWRGGQLCITVPVDMLLLSRVWRKVSNLSQESYDLTSPLAQESAFTSSRDTRTNQTTNHQPNQPHSQSAKPTNQPVVQVEVWVSRRKHQQCTTLDSQYSRTSVKILQHVHSVTLSGNDFPYLPLLRLLSDGSWWITLERCYYAILLLKVVLDDLHIKLFYL